MRSGKVKLGAYTIAVGDLSTHLNPQQLSLTSSAHVTEFLEEWLPGVYM